MICNRCGKEFGAGAVCQNCGADKVSALGEFCGYTFPQNTPNMVQYPSREQIPSTSSMPSMMDIPSLICWKCEEVIPGDSKYCPVCGTLLFVNCPNCGHKYSAKYLHCNQCGTNREEYEKVKEFKEREAKEREAREREAMLQQIKQDEDYHLVFDYVRKMALYFEINTMFVNCASAIKTDYLEQYYINHYPIINKQVQKVVGYIVQDISYWNRRDCLDELALEEECARVFAIVTKKTIAVY